MTEDDTEVWKVLGYAGTSLNSQISVMQLNHSGSSFLSWNLINVILLPHNTYSPMCQWWQVIIDPYQGIIHIFHS